MNKFISEVGCGAQHAATVVVKKTWSFVRNPRVTMVLALLFVFVLGTFAQSMDAGITAITNSTTSLTKYLPVVTKLCYALAGIVAILGAIGVYIKMNNEEQDVKKSIMMVVGACLFLIAAAQCLPMFFGLTNK